MTVFRKPSLHAGAGAGKRASRWKRVGANRCPRHEEKVLCEILEPMLRKQEATVKQVPSLITKHVVGSENASGKMLAARLS